MTLAAVSNSAAQAQQPPEPWMTLPSAGAVAPEAERQVTSPTTARANLLCELWVGRPGHSSPRRLRQRALLGRSGSCAPKVGPSGWFLIDSRWTRPQQSVTRVLTPTNLWQSDVVAVMDHLHIRKASMVGLERWAPSLASSLALKRARVGCLAGVRIRRQHGPERGKRQTHLAHPVFSPASRNRRKSD